MLDKLIDLILQFIRLFQFFTIIEQYQNGVRMTLGKTSDTKPALGPGLHFFWPFNIAHILKQYIALTTRKVGPMSLTTKDGKDVTISAIISFRVVDVKIFLIDIDGHHTFVQDISTGPISKAITRRTWDALTDESFDLDNELTKKVKAMQKKYGVEIDQVQVHDFTRCRVLRLVGSAAAELGPQVNQ